MRKIGLILAGFVANPVYFECNPSCPTPTPTAIINATGAAYTFSTQILLGNNLAMAMAIGGVSIGAIAMFIAFKRKDEKEEDTESREEVYE
jgi:hypothetical protein